jgi:hypothetical protein
MTPDEEKEQAMKHNPVHGSCSCGYKLEVAPAWIGHKFTCIECGALIGVTRYGILKAVK